MMADMYTGSDQIFEFKADEGRVLCFFMIGKRLILTHGFTKKSEKTPMTEIERAEAIKRDFIERDDCADHEDHDRPGISGFRLAKAKFTR